MNGIFLPLVALSLRLASNSADAVSDTLFAAGWAQYQAYNQDAALLQFTACTAHNPRAWMCRWGSAQAHAALHAIYGAELPSDLVDQVNEAAAQADDAVTAQLLAGLQRLITDPDAHTRLDTYTQHLRDMVHAYPDDADIAFLLADALLLKKTTGCHGGGGMFADDAEVFGVLAQALRSSPNHAGLHHLVIHVTERSSHPENGLASAQRLPTLAEGRPHLVHMPGHTYLRLGRYAEAAEANVAAIALDDAYLNTVADAGWYYDSLVLHNRHFLWFTLIMQQKLDEAQSAATALVAGIRPQTHRLPGYVARLSAAPAITAIRRGEGIAMGERDGLYAQAMGHLANGLLALREAQPAQAKQHAAGLHDLIESLQVLGLAEVGKLASTLLEAEIEAYAGSLLEADRFYRMAVAQEDALPYMEPWEWQLPVREFYAAACLAHGDAQRASDVCDEELQRHPRNPYALTVKDKAVEALHARDGAQQSDERACGAAERACAPDPTRRRERP